MHSLGDRPPEEPAGVHPLSDAPTAQPRLQLRCKSPLGVVSSPAIVPERTGEGGGTAVAPGHTGFPVFSRGAGSGQKPAGTHPEAPRHRLMFRFHPPSTPSGAQGGLEQGDGKAQGCSLAAPVAARSQEQPAWA